MTIGLVGSGNMARALARGWGEPVLCTDAGSGRAQALAAELGGEALAGNAELARRADVVVLAHKPQQLGAVAAEIAPILAARDGALVVSLLARTPLSALAEAYPGVPVFRVEPNLPVERRRGVTIFVQGDGDPEAAAQVKTLFERVGAVVTMPDAMVEAAAACSGVGPAYWAVFVEAWIDAAIRKGVKPADASVLVVQTMAGTAELLRAREWDTLALRREVASPGGSTSRGLAALERGGVRAALSAAMDDVVDA